ncbi:MAG: FG-GAP repeat protein [Planctomycetes bacterium]|nr:FG-GAP repeat protein [Planctomycetota bacterium]
MKSSKALAALVCGGGLFLTGCPTVPPSEFVPGQTGDATSLGATASVVVLSPVSNLAIAGGTPVEVNWSTVATTNFAILDVIVDKDQDPSNGNEVVMLENISLTQQSALINTATLEAGSYYVGVRLFERNELAASDYAPGRLIVNQATQLYFNSPRSNFTFDRTEAIAPRFDVDWTLLDPDSTVTVKILLDPDSTPDGDEFLLRTSTSQTGDRFTFNLPTASFPAGTYRILALVNDGIADTAFYAPGSIRLRARFAGALDLRNLGLPSAPVAGAIFEGFNPRDNNGSFLARCRDLDRDGLGDFIMLAQFGKPFYSYDLQRVGVGEAYLVYGRRERFSGTVSVNSTGRLFRGDVFTGVPEVQDPIRPTRGLSSFTILSDWERDGLRDMAFGVPFTDSLPVNALDSLGYFRTGGVVVVSTATLRPDYGFPGGLTPNLGNIGSLPMHGTGQLPGCAEGFYGPKAPPSGQGGSSTYYWRHLTNGEFTHDQIGCRISTNEFGDNCGETLSTYDFDSLIISVPDQDPFIGMFDSPVSVPGGGAIYTYSNLVDGPFYPWNNLNTPPANAATNWGGMPAHPSFDVIPHDGPFYYIIGDTRIVNGPGGSNLLAMPGYTVDPDDSPDPCSFTVSGNCPSETSTVRFWSSVEGGRLSNAVGVDDFNADGLQDYLVGQPLANNGAGTCYIVFGRLQRLVLGFELKLDELGLPMNTTPPGQARIFDGLHVRGGAGERLGLSQDAAGDFNGDGIPDVVLGSPLLNQRQGGACVFFGSHELINLTEDEIAFNEIPTRNLGVIITGETEGDLAGAQVAGTGDVDGDGLSDILIAAPDKSVRLDLDGDGTLDIDREGCGVVYLIYGSSTLRGTVSVKDIGTEKLGGAMFVGRNSGDHLGAGLGEQGDRSHGIANAGDVDGDGRIDLLISSVLASPRDRVRAGEVYLIYGQGD